ncbi:FkbM family methyltransferase [Phreatobacter sp.]|uniref:FkbM family methyltransferase n=1 Tax=Phreatobacter sp. TaxID=1966341 RepID=UPI003F6E9B2E
MSTSLTAWGRPQPMVIRPGGIVSLADIAHGERYDLECACRSAAQPFYLGNGIALARVLGRYKVYLSTEDRGFASHLLLDGYWEMWLTQFVARILKPGMVAVDVGANMGYYSVLFSDLVGPQGRVIAVEPLPSTVTLLRRSMELNGFAARSRVVPAAAGSGSGIGKLRVPEGEPKNATLVSTRMGGDMPDKDEVPIVALDDVLHGESRVDFIKIDTEGFEEHVMLGLEATIERWKPTIVLEFNPLRCKDPDRLVSRLHALYGQLHVIGFDAVATPVSDAQLLDRSDREDRLVYLAGRG